MKAIVTTFAAAGLAAVFAMPAQAETAQQKAGLNSAAQVEHTDISAHRRHWRHRHGYRYRPYGYYGPRYGYHRPYGYYRPYYSPGVSLGFWGGPRFGVWF